LPGKLSPRCSATVLAGLTTPSCSQARRPRMSSDIRLCTDRRKTPPDACARRCVGVGGGHRGRRADRACPCSGEGWRATAEARWCSTCSQRGGPVPRTEPQRGVVRSRPVTAAGDERSAMYLDFARRAWQMRPPSGGSRRETSIPQSPAPRHAVGYERLLLHARQKSTLASSLGAERSPR
jgi:hypothetical protein